MIIESGANVILTTGGIDDVANKYLVEKKILGLRRVSKGDIRKIAKCAGAQVVTSLSNMEGNEAFDAANLGFAKKVYEKAVGDNDFIFFEQMKSAKACSILLRGPNETMLDEIERSLHDSLCVLKRTLECGSVVAGGGACEIALSIYLEDFAKTLASKEQIAIAEYIFLFRFCEALTIIPKTLATNAAQDATDLIAKLKVFHSASQTSDDPKKKDLKWTGLDLKNGKCRNNLNAGVLEPLDGKIK